MGKTHGAGVSPRRRKGLKTGKKEEVLEKKILLSSPTMHGEELEFVRSAYETNWITTVGENIDELEKAISEYTGSPYAVALSSGTAALHMAVRLAGEKLYGQVKAGKGVLYGKKVFCSDMTFGATVNPVAYEGGEAIFIDTEKDSWNMDPQALEAAYKIYPEVRIIIIAHLYGTPGKMEEIRRIASDHQALIIEDAAESLGATYLCNDGQRRQTGTMGDYGVLSFNGNKIITGSSGGMLLTGDHYSADKVRKWSTQSREDAPWYQHEEIGYNYRMSNVIAGIVRGQLLHLNDHLREKRRIYETYQKAFSNCPLKMNPYEEERVTPNFWLSCILVDRGAMCRSVCGEKEAIYITEEGKTCPSEIRDQLLGHNIESRPLWKPMHMQPVYRNHPFVTRAGNGRGQSNAYLDNAEIDEGKDLFYRGLCLPSDIKMTGEEQERVIGIVLDCFR